MNCYCCTIIYIYYCVFVFSWRACMRLITCTVVSVVPRKLSKELIDWAQLIQNEMTSFWQCPFSLQVDFQDIGLVSMQFLLSHPFHLLPTSLTISYCWMFNFKHACTALVSWNLFCPCITMHMSVCLCVCPPLRALTANGMIWCGIGLVWLVKPILRFLVYCYL